jgi:hypothetical protein
MTAFERFIQAVISNLDFSFLPAFPACEKCTKTDTKYFQNSKKIVSKIKLEK